MFAASLFRSAPTARRSDLGAKASVGYSAAVDNNLAVAALSALAFNTRLDAVQLLVDQGREGLAAGEIARKLGIPANTLSDHLQVLVRAGILSAERHSRSIVYKANPPAIDALMMFLGKTCQPKAATPVA